MQSLPGAGLYLSVTFPDPERAIWWSGLLGKVGVVEAERVLDTEKAGKTFVSLVDYLRTRVAGLTRIDPKHS
ncbi:hypothetical protein ACIBCN_29190 [Nocardia sp. NPDC051052]|uniref:hypothetical protein n=1 Tax=Nocardia sp. NPDC051052 TaxID=3364322 RepID=UPI00379BBD1F